VGERECGCVRESVCVGVWVCENERERETPCIGQRLQIRVVKPTVLTAVGHRGRGGGAYETPGPIKFNSGQQEGCARTVPAAIYLQQVRCRLALW